MTEKQIKIVKTLRDTPVQFAHLLGFTLLTDIHNEWMHNMITAKKDETLQGHRGSYKTTCLSVVIAILMILVPNKRIMFMRKTDNDIKEIIKQVAKILQDPHTIYLVQLLHGVTLKLVVCSATEISTNLITDIKGAAQLTGLGMGASLTGKHFDIIFTDDIVNVKDRISHAEREQTKIIYQELQNIKNRNGRIFNTGTPWHKDDAFSIMPAPEKYDCYSTGLISAEELEKIKGSMVSSLFAANYELRHIASEDIIFTEPAKGADIACIENGVMQVDAAFYGEDYTALTIMQIHDGKYYVLGKVWRKHVEDCYNDISALYARHLCSKMYMETNADKGMVARDIRQLGLKTVTYHEKMNKYLKIVTYLKAIWQDVVFVEGTDPEYLDQICDYNENAEHDDAPDSCASLARIFYKRNRGNRDSTDLWMLG